MPRAAVLATLMLPAAAAAVDLAALWDFNDPAASEQRLRAALAGAQGDDALLLQTQIARSHGLRRDFEASRRTLQALQPQRDGAGPEVQAHWWLEWGRSHVSATHDAAALGPAARQAARQAFGRAEAIARAARLDALAIDAIHMQAFVDTAPADQLRWGESALALVMSSDQPAARRWEASIRHNLGLALRALVRHEAALAQFRAAQDARAARGDVAGERIARWMVARTLRELGRTDEALALQLQLEQAHAADGSPDPQVFEELALLYGARGDDARARHYAERQRAGARP